MLGIVLCVIMLIDLTNDPHLGTLLLIGICNRILRFMYIAYRFRSKLMKLFECIFLMCNDDDTSSFGAMGHYTLYVPIKLY